MNFAICKNTWTELLRSRLRLVLLVVFFLGPIFLITIEYCNTYQFPVQPLSSPFHTVWLAWVIGSGTVGRHVQDGTLSLVLSRPISIASFVLSKWLALFVATAAVTSLQLVAELIVEAARNPQFEISALIANFLGRIICSFEISAVVVGLSSLVTGAKDLGLYLLFAIASYAFEAFAEIKPSATLSELLQTLLKIAINCSHWIGQILKDIFLPNYDLATFIATGIPSYVPVLAYFAIVTSTLSLAIFFLNRRELPYGSA